ncbi:MAG TPA: hypothetical protein VMH91_00590 [Candidatus Paceibacterota bacterium]|nr:hypothetical protein [Candidatus Paceibacterota bacterium]
MQDATLRAIMACAVFAVAGIVAFLYFPRANESLLLAGYYAVLVLNTFLSIKAFAAITPKNIVQSLFDAALVLTYIALAFSLGSVLQFSVVSWILFVLANAKYAHLERLVPQKEFLRHKMRINWLGALLSAGAFVIAAFGFPIPAAWALFCLYGLANIYLLGIDPMYRIR